jgi:hypothetical protein
MTPLHDLNPDDLYEWTCIFETAVEFEAELVRGFLADAEIPVQILSKKDSSYTSNVGHLSLIYVYVPVDKEAEAKAALESLDNKD